MLTWLGVAPRGYFAASGQRRWAFEIVWKSCGVSAFSPKLARLECCWGCWVHLGKVRGGGWWALDRFVEVAQFGRHLTLGWHWRPDCLLVIVYRVHDPARFHANSITNSARGGWRTRHLENSTDRLTVWRWRPSCSVRTLQIIKLWEWECPGVKANVSTAFSQRKYAMASSNKKYVFLIDLLIIAI